MILAEFPVEELTFFIAGAICIAGSLGVVLFRNPVHNALSLVATLFGVAVLFIAQEAYFLAAIQVIVYAGAIVVLFLFVIMLLGVDRIEALAAERQPALLAAAGAFGAGIVVLAMTAVLAGSGAVTGRASSTAPLDVDNDLARIGEVLFTDYVFAFEITSLLLTIAVVGAVVLSRKASGPPIDLDEFPEQDQGDDDEGDDPESTPESAESEQEASS